MKQLKKLCPVVLLGVFFISGLLFGAEVSVAEQNPCSADIAKFCKDIQPGKRAMMECLERNESQLSDACKEYEARMENPRMEAREVALQQMGLRQSCGDDIARFCGDVKPGSGGVQACLKEHMKELSMPCKDAVEAAKGGAEERTGK
jgi:hypothetical protein